jgi:geranylgeranyl diphosphate synthase type II
MNFSSPLSQLLEDSLKNYIDTLPKKSLYEPANYILNLGGKRIRPQLTLFAAKAFGGEVQKAIPLALAVEVFHNFSLVHDDIMDKAPLRRGKQTVHTKWNDNTAILSGDAMLVLVYQLINQTNATVAFEANKIFNQVALEVCEGQMSDMEFEQTENVLLSDYTDMIRQKTAVLLGGALQLGAISAGASPEKQKAVYNFGVNLGIAFQLKDDLLDAFGNSAQVGKQIGGDILSNKKTFLYLKALEIANDAQKSALKHWFSLEDYKNPNEKIEAVKNIFLALNIQQLTQHKVDEYSNDAIKNLDLCGFAQEDKKIFQDLTNYLLNRVN